MWFCSVSGLRSSHRSTKPGYHQRTTRETRSEARQSTGNRIRQNEKFEKICRQKSNGEFCRKATTFKYFFQIENFSVPSLSGQKRKAEDEEKTPKRSEKHSKK